MKGSVPSSRKAGKSKGFTLVELMVVIVIVTILASLAFMMANKARKKADSMTCVQNLRDWSIVFANCASDNNGRLYTPANWAAISHTSYDPDNRDNPGRSPFVDYWNGDIEVALGIQLEKRGCPCQADSTTPSGNPGTGYMMNRRLSKAPKNLEIHLASLHRASRKIIFIDGNPGCPLEIKSSADATKWVEPAAEVHGGTVNAVFADFHVAPLRPKELQENWRAMMLPTTSG